MTQSKPLLNQNLLHKSKPITIIVEERDGDLELTNEMKTILDARLQEDESTYLSANESMKALNNLFL